MNRKGGTGLHEQGLGENKPTENDAKETSVFNDKFPSWSDS